MNTFEYVYVVTDMRGAIVKIYSTLAICIDGMIRDSQIDITARDKTPIIFSSLQKFGKYYVENGFNKSYINRVRVHDKANFKYNIA
jgi:hypothetical protein